MAEQITTAEELDALPVGSVVLDGAGRASQAGPDCQDDARWWRTGEVMLSNGRTAERVLRYGPVTLLHRPDAVADTSPHAEPTTPPSMRGAVEIVDPESAGRTVRMVPVAEVDDEFPRPTPIDLRALVGLIAERDWSTAEPTPVGDLRERVAAVLWDDAERDAPRRHRYSWDYLTENAARWPHAYGPIRDRWLRIADAVLVVVDPDGERR